MNTDQKPQADMKLLEGADRRNKSTSGEVTCCRDVEPRDEPVQAKEQNHSRLQLSADTTIKLGNIGPFLPQGWQEQSTRKRGHQKTIAGYLE